MVTIREKIIAYLQQHQNGIDDDALAEALQLSARQQANSRCRQLEREGLVIRRRVNGKIHNFWNEGKQPPPTPPNVKPDNVKPWFWEGNVQTSVVRYLEQRDYVIRSAANTASKERGKDIEAEHDGEILWITVKGYPEGTKRTHPSTQAGHWFKQATFDILQYRGENGEARLGMALPDFPRYRSLAQKIKWFQPVAKFTYYWVQESGKVTEESYELVL